MSTKFLSPGWRMPRNANQSKQSNYSMSFGGTQYIDAGTGLGDSLGTYTGDASISLWFKANTTTSNDGLFSITPFNGSYFGSLRISIYNNGLYFSGNSTNGSAPVNYKYTSFSDTTNWHHVVCIFKSGDITNSKIYIDGVDQTTTDVGTFASSLSLTGFKTIIGAYRGNVNTFNGQINEVSIFDYALSSSQITTLYGTGSAIGNPMALPSPPIAYYPLGTSAYNGEYLAENNAIGDYVFDFSGGTDIISYSNINLTGNRTVSFWVNINSPLTGAVYLGSGGNDYYPYINATSVFLRSSTQGSSSITQPSIVTGKWYHYCITGDGTNATLYRDGVLIGTLADKSLIINTIGGTPIGSNDINAKMSNVQIFNTALSGTEVTTLYNYGSPIQTLANIPQNSNLKAWYKLDASEIYNSSTTEWSIDNNQNPSAYPSSLDFVSSESDYIDCGDSDSLSFVNGTTDLPFSVSTWVNFNDITNSSLFSKTNVAPNFWEYSVHINSDEKIYFGLYSQGDVSGSNYIFVGSTATLTSYEGSWINLTFTYDGSGSVSGLKIYLNGDEMSTSTFVNGTYIAMTNTAAPFRIGRSFNNKYLDGNSSNLALFNSKLSEPQVTELYNNGTPLSDMSSFTSLVSWWKLNNTTTGIGNSLSPWTSSLDFNGSDYIDCGASSFSGETEISVSAWVYPTATGTGAAEAVLSTERTSSTSRGFYLSLYVGNEFRWQVSTDGSLKDSLDSGTILLNQWSHVVATWNQSTMSLYVNGSLVDTMNTVNATGTFTTTNNIFIAKRDSSAGFFPGSISNASIWNTALSPSQITELYNNGAPSNLSSHSVTSNLISWWKLNNLTTGIEDSKGSNNGTNNGATESIGLVSTLNGTNNGATEYTGFVNTLVGDSSGMTQANLVQSDLQTVAPYSKYALNFDSESSDYIQIPYNVNLTPQNGNFTISAWINTDNLSGWRPIWCTQNLSSTTPVVALHTFDDKVRATVGGSTNNPSYGGSWALLLDSTQSLTTSTWYHIAVSYNMSGNAQIYINGSPDNSGPIENPQTSWNTGDRFIGEGEGYWNGRISNVSIWNTELTSTQVTELYNEGLPSDLNSHSAYSNLISWWQLGENSSFASNWICADEKGTNNGTSANMGVDALVNGVGTTANGVSSGMSEGNLVGDAPYSTANALSSGMSVVSRVTGSGNTP